MKSYCRRLVARTLACGCISALLLTASPTLSVAASGTLQVAWIGSPVKGRPSWPEGVERFVNLPVRTTGWSQWSTEGPCDVNRYGFHTKSMAELNSLVEKFSAIKSDHLRIILSPELGPSRPPEFHGESAEFSIGDQNSLSRWFEGLEVDSDGVRHFGVHRFDKPPTAQPPTLTIFLKHRSVKAEELRIPPKVFIERPAPRRAIGGEIISIF